MRAAFNYECVAWRHHDKSWECIPLPLEWRPPDYRGEQIELSRYRHGLVRSGEPAAEYIAAASYPETTEIRETQRCFLEWLRSNPPAPEAPSS